MRPSPKSMCLALCMVSLLLFVGDMQAQSGRPTGNIRPGEAAPPLPHPGGEAGRPARITAPVVSAPPQGSPRPPATPSPGGPIGGSPVWPPTVIVTPVIVVQDPVILDSRPPCRPTGVPAPEVVALSPDEVLPLEVHLRNRTVQPALAGYSFHDDQHLPWDHQETDVYFESIGEAGCLSTPSDTRIIDLGATDMVQDIGGVPRFPGMAEGRVEAHFGHGYVLRLWDRTLVRVRVISVSGEDVRFEWLPLGKDPVSDPVSFGR